MVKSLAKQIFGVPSLETAGRIEDSIRSRHSRPRTTAAAPGCGSLNSNSRSRLRKSALHLSADILQEAAE
jgi:hypothetical protein